MLFRSHAHRPNEGRRAKGPVTRGWLRITERAAAYSLQFGTYALWTAGLLAALAVRPVPSCMHHFTTLLPHCVTYSTPKRVWAVRRLARFVTGCPASFGGSSPAHSRSVMAIGVGAHTRGFDLRSLHPSARVRRPPPRAHRKASGSGASCSGSAAGAALPAPPGVPRLDDKVVG